MSNKSLGRARQVRNDEFYTQRIDVENELRHYDSHFRDKVVLCNCDDPRVSEFYLYFKRKFSMLGLRKLIAATYRNADPDTRRPHADLLNEAEDKPDVQAKSLQAACVEYEGKKTGRPRKMKGDGKYHGGDFRSSEAIALLQQADVVVTNPPFSLFREYVAQLVKYEKKFVIIGPSNALHYRDIFKLIMANQLWLGYGFSGGNAFFGVRNSEGFAKGVYDAKTGLVKFRNVVWFTNLDIDKRHDDLMLTRKYNESDYPKYDNYDAINVDKVKLIPRDYAGVMGVPDTFVAYYNPDQFELLANLGTGKVKGKTKYSRMLIRNKRPQS